MFEASWRVFAPGIKHIESNIGRHKRLIESGESYTKFEEVQNVRQAAVHEFEKQMRDQDILRQDRVHAWLCHFSCEAQQEHHRNTRSVCKDPGRWLLDHARFQEWYDPDDCSEPLLWLSGIPGAGMSLINITFTHELHVLTKTRQDHSRISNCG